MKLIGSILIILFSGMGFCLVFGGPFFMCWNVMPFSQPEITWVQGTGMLFILWSSTFVIFFAKAIGEAIADGAKVKIKEDTENG